MRRPLLLFFLCGIFCFDAQGWGFWAHQRLNRMAVFTLPPEMLGLYKNNLEYLTIHAVDPDKRRYAIDGEAERHFIDIDHYGSLPFANVPRYWKEAVEMYSEDTLRAYGILPYQLPVQIQKLADAFRAKDPVRILKLSADIGHYVGDAHVPLHTTENYNGQFTNQVGIHGFWESRLPELFAEKYDFFVGRAFFIDDIHMEIWNTVLESHTALDSVLSMEQQLNDTFSPDKKYGYESRNRVTVRTYSRPYSEAYHNMLNGQVERRMRASILRIGSFWYTAWKLAGSPDLRGISHTRVSDRPKSYQKKLKLKDREGSGYGFHQPLFRRMRQVDYACCCDPSQGTRTPVIHPPSLYQIGRQVNEETRPPASALTRLRKWLWG